MSELKTVRVPGGFEPVFLNAERLVSAYFQLRVADPSRGCIEIANQRYVLIRAASLSVEFFALVENLYGEGRQQEAHDFARNILFDLAHAIGKSDAHEFHSRMGLDDPIARLSAGPVHFAHAGWAFVDISPESQPSPDSGYHLLYDHPYSFEADAWLHAERQANFPVCIMNAGYSSGWCEESFSMPLVASEILCRGRGDECCRFIMATPETIEARVEKYIVNQPSLANRIRGYQIPDFFARKRVEEELRAARDELERRVVERTADLREANDRLRREITDRERMQRHLARSQRLETLGRLAGGVAHDFNNQLGVIMGYSSTMQRRVPEDDPMHTMLGEITKAAVAAADLTRQLMVFSRTELPNRRRLDLGLLATRLITMLQRMVGEEVRLETCFSDESAVVEADAGQLEQLIINLVINARDAMPEGGTLTLSTRLRPAEDNTTESERASDAPPEAGQFGWVRLSVTDTGVGMSKSVQARIFDPFFTTKGLGEGAGLGLSTAYGVVAEHGGTIAVHSELGCGARFDIDLPLVAGPASVSPSEQDLGKRTHHGATVLLVEERSGVRALLSQMLEDNGYRALVTGDVEEALRLAKLHRDDVKVLLSDLALPNECGEQLIKGVLSHCPTARVLLMAGHTDDPAVLLEGPGGEHAAVLFKPFTPAELDVELQRLLGTDPSS